MGIKSVISGRINLYMIFDRIRKLTSLEIISLTLLIIHFIYFMWIITERINFRYGLNVMEGNIFYSELKLLSGYPLSGDPDIFPIGTLGYTPLYQLIFTPLIAIFGKSMIWARILSVTATLGSAFLIYKIVNKYSERVFIGIISALFYFMYNDLLKFTFDAVRSESLLTFFCIAAIYFASENIEKKLNFFMAIILSVLAIYIKQTGVFASGVIFVYLFFNHRKYAYKYLLYSVLLSALIFLYFEYTSDGWFSFWVLEYGSRDAIYLSRMRVLQVFFRTSGVITLGVAIYIFYMMREDRKNLQYIWVIGLIASAMFGTLGLLKHGGVANSLMPFAAIICIVLGMALGYIQQNSKEKSNKSVIWNIAMLAVIFQTFLMFYRPEIPNARDHLINDKIENYVNDTDGPVYVGSQSAYAFLNEKEVSDDIAIYSRIVLLGLAKQDRLINDFENRSYSLIISRMKAETPEMKEAIYRNYELVEVISNKGAEILYGVEVYKPKADEEKEED